MNAMRTIALILKKDVLVELRTREVVVTMGLFALLLLGPFFGATPTRDKLPKCAKDESRDVCAEGG